ncbi:RDD family protein [Pontibacter vulgaris]|uniref:RDD family protein n=1 Tax=Pontibacter vulgaris TaxID=2905679 RepID=UPI001FA6F20F
MATLVDTTILVFFYSVILYSTANDPQQQVSWKEIIHQHGLGVGQLVFIFKTLFFNLYFPVLHWLYYTLLEASPKQATIGKFTLGLKVTDLRGKRISFAQANLRYFSKLASAAPFLLGFLLILSTRRNQMLHDYIARTVVVTEQ